MEKQGVVRPGITPPLTTKTLTKKAAENAQDECAAIIELEAEDPVTRLAKTDKAGIQ